MTDKIRYRVEGVGFKKPRVDLHTHELIGGGHYGVRVLVGVDGDNDPPSEVRITREEWGRLYLSPLAALFEFRARQATLRDICDEQIVQREGYTLARADSVTHETRDTHAALHRLAGEMIAERLARGDEWPEASR